MRINPPAFWERLPEIFAYPLKGSGAYALVGLTVFSAMMKLLPVFGALLTAGFTFSLLFNVIKMTGQGKGEFPGFSEYFDYWDNIILPNIRGTLTYAIAILPLAVYLIFIKDRSGLDVWDFKALAKFLLDPMFFFLFLFGIFYFPMATCLAAINENVFHMLNPFIGFNLIRKTLSSYTLLFLFVCAFSALNVVAYLSIQSAFTALHFPSVGLLFKIFARLYFSTVSAATMGFWVFQNGETLGYLDASYYESEPKFIPYSGQTRDPQFTPPLANSDLLGDEIALAEGKMKEGKEAEAQRIYHDLYLRFPEDHRATNILLDFAITQQDQSKITLYGEHLLEYSIREGDLSQALSIYKKLIPLGPRLQMGAQTLLQLAQLFYRQKAYGFAAKAYLHLGFLYPEDPKTIKGFLLLGDLYLEKFRTPEKAVELFGLLNALHPDSPLSPQIIAGLRKASANVPG